MKKLLLTTALCLAATPAFACHRFHVWRYPFAQRCAVVTNAVHIRAPSQDVQDIEITPVMIPPETEEEQRADAIDRLRPLLDELVASRRALQ